MKKMISKSIVLMTAMALTTNVFATTAGLENFVRDAEKEPVFTDVPAGAWYEESVKMVNQYGLMEGNSESSFNPDGNITGAEAIVLASRLHSSYWDNQYEFKNGNTWYQDYVDYAIENGIILEERSEYTLAISRAEFIGIVSNAFPESAFLAINQIEEGMIPDVLLSDAYGASIYMFYEAGILAGSDAYGTFLPDETITRSAVAAILVRVVDESSRMEISLQEKTVVPVAVYTTASLALYIGDTQTLATSFAPENTNVTSVTWASTNPSVATVTSSGLVTAVSEGTAQITVTATTGVSTACSLTVSEKPVLKESDIDMRFTIPHVGAMNSYAKVHVTNNSGADLEVYGLYGSLARINGYNCRNSDFTVETGTTVTRVVYSDLMSYAWTTNVNKSKSPMYLDNNSQAVFRVRWQDEQYNVTFDVNGTISVEQHVPYS